MNTYEGAMFAYLQEWEVPPLCQIHPDMLGQGFYWLAVAACDAAALPGKLRFNDISETFSGIFLHLQEVSHQIDCVYGVQMRIRTLRSLIAMLLTFLLGKIFV